MSNEILKNLFRLLSIAWRRRYLLCVPMLIMPFVGFVVSFMTPKYYEAHTTILLQDTSELNPILEDFSVSTSLEERQAALKILLKSRKVFGSVAEELGYLSADSTQFEIDKPFTPSSPNKLPAALFILAGFFAGLGIGTGLTAIAEISDTSLRLQETIEKMAGIPVLARLPNMPDAPLLAYDASSDTFNREEET